jgi:hypothetical protein
MKHKHAIPDILEDFENSEIQKLNVTDPTRIALIIDDWSSLDNILWETYSQWITRRE